MTDQTMDAEIEVVLDLGGLRQPPDTPDALASLWDEIEPGLHGRRLRVGGRLEMQRRGVVTVDVVRVAPGVGVVGPCTRFGVVAVREPAHLRYRCRVCLEQGIETYGPFVCASCRSDRGRLCDDHVSMIDGGLVSMCPDHRVGCADCGRPATFWCHGPICLGEAARCDEHRHPHPNDPLLDFCRRCHDDLFPVCISGACEALGTVPCEHRQSDGARCAARMCSRHARRWQAFGGERVGLGRCEAHGDPGRLSADDLLFQIVTGATFRKPAERLPSLAGFAHNLRRYGHEALALDVPEVHRRLTAPDPRLETVARVTRALDGAGREWRRELDGWVVGQGRGRALLDRIRTIVTNDGGFRGPEIALALELAEYKPPNRHRARGLLYVVLPESLRGPLIGVNGARIAAIRAELDVDVRFEGESR